MPSLTLPVEFFNLNQVKTSCKNVVFTYILLRLDWTIQESAGAKSNFINDKHAASSLTAQELSVKSGLGEITIKDILVTLKQKGWIKCQENKPDTYLLGDLVDGKEQWYIDKPVEVKETLKIEFNPKPNKTITLDAIRQKIVNGGTGGAANLSKNLFKPSTKAVFLPKDAVNYFAKKYFETYEERYPTNYAKDVACIKKCLEYFEGDYVKLFDLIDFTFDNWTFITQNTFIKNRILICSLSNQTVWSTISGLRKDGLKTKVSSITNRADGLKTEEKTSGW